MQPFSMQDLYDGIFEDEKDVLIIKDRDFKDQNLSRIIERCYENEPALKGITFEKCQFNKVIFEGNTIDRRLTFEECYFCGPVLFKECNFCAELSFHRSTFYKTTVFDNCCYANYHFDFSEIKTEKSCEYFAILNTQHNQKFDKPCYTILSFKKAIFNSVVAFNELKDLSFIFFETVFNNEFYFTNTILGVKTLFGRNTFPSKENLSKEKKMELLLCFQILSETLRRQSRDIIDRYITTLSDEIEGNTSANFFTKEIYTEDELCAYAGIGRPTLQKLKTDVKNGKKKIKLPQPYTLKPLTYLSREVEAFRATMVEERIRKSKK